MHEQVSVNTGRWKQKRHILARRQGGEGGGNPKQRWLLAFKKTNQNREEGNKLSDPCAIGRARERSLGSWKSRKGWGNSPFALTKFIESPDITIG